MQSEYLLIFAQLTILCWVIIKLDVDAKACESQLMFTNHFRNIALMMCL